MSGTLPGEKNPDVIWWRVNWKTSDDTWYPLWIDDDMAACPERINEFDSLLSERMVKDYTKTFSDG